MIRITFEIIPLGIEANKKTVSTLVIHNDITGTKTKGNYKYRFHDKRDRIYMQGNIKGFDRKGVSKWRLVKLILDEVFK